jgi:hypothetical protein
VLAAAENFTAGQRALMRGASDDAAPSLHKWATDNAAALQLDADLPIQAKGFHPTFRVAPSGRLVIELVAQFVQRKRETGDDLAFGGLRFRGGTTIVATADGVVRFVIAKPIASEQRRKRQLAFVEAQDIADPALSWSDDDYGKTRIARLSFRGLHEGNPR